jgi:RNA polymerase sigma-70 factor (ECF subfamily)
MTNDRVLFWRLAEPEMTRANLFCRKLAGGREQGDDLFQDGLVIALTRFADLRDHAAFRAWLYRILINTYRSRMRLRWWRRLAPLTEPLESSLPGDDPGERYAARRWLERGFRALTSEDRTLVALHELEGWPLADLAAVYGKSEGALAARLARARKKLRERLDPGINMIPKPDPAPVEEDR